MTKSTKVLIVLSVFALALGAVVGVFALREILADDPPPATPYDAAIGLGFRPELAAIVSEQATMTNFGRLLCTSEFADTPSRLIGDFSYEEIVEESPHLADALTPDMLADWTDYVRAYYACGDTEL